MPTANSALLVGWERLGLKEAFLRDYPALSRDELLAKYGPHTGASPARQWQRLIEIASLLGVKRGRRGRVAQPPPPSEPKPPETAPSATVQQDVRVAGLQAELEHYKQLYREAVKGRAAEEQFLEVLRNCVTALAPVPVRPLIANRGRKDDLHTACAILSDPHIGERVDLAQTGGLGAYNIEIFGRRLGLWAAKVLELVELRRTRLLVPDLRLLVAGDMVGGDLHEDLVRTNVVNNVDAAARGAYMLAQVTMQLAAHFDRVEVDCVIGNHGRLSPKVWHKDAYANWDYVLYQLWALLCQHQSNVRFNISRSIHMLTEVQKHVILLTHGAGIKSWAGIPWYGIERAVLHLRELLDLKHERFDMVVLAHFHETVETERFIVNSSFKGLDEYSVNALRRGSRPSQVLFYMHPQYGNVGSERIYLQAADTRPELQVPDGLPGVWAEAVAELASGRAPATA